MSFHMFIYFSCTCRMYEMLRFQFLPLIQISLLFVLLNNIQIGYCIDCYDCDSDDSHCGEDPDGDLLIVDGKVSSGCHSCVKEFKALGTIWSRVTRRCGTSTETSDSCSDVLGYGKCVCTTTFCNHGNSIHVSRTVLMFTFSLLLYFLI